MKGLMMHCGAESISKQDLANIAPPKAFGARHNPVPYIDFIDTIQDYMHSQGLVITEESYGVTVANKKGVEVVGARMFGLMQLESIYGDYAPMLGVRGSYDQTLPRGLALGSGVFVCDNLCFSGEVTIKTKQTTFINDRLPQLISQAVDKIPAMIEHQHERFDIYRNHEIKQRKGDAMIVDMVRRDIINPSQVGHVIEQWDTPIKSEHAENGFSLWRLMNAVTEAIKPKSNRPVVLDNWDRTTKLTQYLDRFAA